MTREDFIKKLDDILCPYNIEDGKIIISVGSYSSYSDLTSLESLPEGIKFVGEGVMDLSNLIEIPYGTEFNNSGVIFLYGVKKIHPGVKFNQNQQICLFNLVVGTKFTFRFRVDGISDSYILNNMISLGIFNKGI
jgi:hypothetical protein